ncbi:MAG: hypothetical protein BWX60_00120 [Candidatus Marinimicrobia bacterium ADurb.Bin030]|nr:MAG: hypothetical protein BWX60_00120 [Candidatus Marinimicrobia bacterium ADurb.Bin030]
MFGFIYRLWIQHPNDKENHLISLQLSEDYESTGIFKAGQSYMIRSKTKKEIPLMLKEILAFEIEKNYDRNEFVSWCVGPDCYTVKEHKSVYMYCLIYYIRMLMGIKLGPYQLPDYLDDAFSYITELDNKVAYLESKLYKLIPNYKEKIFLKKWQPLPSWVEGPEKYGLIVYITPE